MDRGTKKIENHCCRVFDQKHLILLLSPASFNFSYSSSGVIESLNDLYLDLKST